MKSKKTAHKKKQVDTAFKDVLLRVALLLFPMNLLILRSRTTAFDKVLDRTWTTSYTQHVLGSEQLLETSDKQ